MGVNLLPSLAGYVKGIRDIAEIPKMQRYVGRPDLKDLLKGIDKKSKEALREKVREAVERYGYSQRETAAYLGVHYSAISRMMHRKKH